METVFGIIGLLILAVACYLAYRHGSSEGFKRGWHEKDRMGGTVHEVSVPVRGTSNPQEHATQYRVRSVLGVLRLNKTELEAAKYEAMRNPHDVIKEVHDGR